MSAGALRGPLALEVCGEGSVPQRQDHITASRRRLCAIGNPLLAIQIIEHVPEVALYAPLRVAVYERNDKTCVAYDRFTSLLAQYQHPQVNSIAQLVEQKVEELVAQATAQTEKGDG